MTKFDRILSIYKELFQSRNTMEPHKRYLVFQYPDYYPLGGLSDCEQSFDTEEECANYISGTNNFKYYNWQVYDRIEGMEVEVKIEEK